MKLNSAHFLFIYSMNRTVLFFSSCSMKTKNSFVTEMVSMIAEDGILCQKEASLPVYGFSQLLLNSEVLNVLNKFGSHLNLSIMVFACSWNKLCIYYTLQIFLKYTRNAYFILKNYIKVLISTRDISFHLKAFFCLMKNSIFFVCFKAKLFPFLVSKIWTMYL